MDDRDDGGGDAPGAGRGRAPRRGKLARRRTEWAEERTLLAKERTFAAWLRTGLASMAVGFGVAELLGEMEPPWLARTIGALLVVAGGVLIGLGYLTYKRTLRKLEEEDVHDTALWPIAGLSLTLVLLAAAGVVLIVRN